MTLWSDLFNSRHMLSRRFYGTPGAVTITAPPKSGYIRVSMVGAGGWGSEPASGAGGVFGYGAAFARTKVPCAAGDQFTLDIGDINHSRDAGDSAGDSKCTKVVGAVVICKAERGSRTAAGSSANSVGDTKRSGLGPVPFAGNFQAGASAGDDADTFPLGFGGRGAARYLAAAAGGGGCNNNLRYEAGAYQVFFTLQPGNGRICVEFFDQDPAIIWPGY